MHGILNPESPVMSFITKITYSAYLNLLWLVCCLPIVTAGASTTALFYVTLKVAKNEEGSLTKSFFHSFRENFRQATVIWLILLAVGIVLGVDGYIFYHMRFENAFWTVATAVFLIAAAAYARCLRDLTTPPRPCLRTPSCSACAFCSARQSWPSYTSPWHLSSSTSLRR